MVPCVHICDHLQVFSIYLLTRLKFAGPRYLLSWLITPGLSKEFSVMYNHALFLCFQILKSDIRPEGKWTVSLMVANGHFSLPKVFVWACMD